MCQFTCLITINSWAIQSIQDPTIYTGNYKMAFLKAVEEFNGYGLAKHSTRVFIDQNAALQLYAFRVSGYSEIEACFSLYSIMKSPTSPIKPLTLHSGLSCSGWCLWRSLESPGSAFAHEQVRVIRRGAFSSILKNVETIMLLCMQFILESKPSYHYSLQPSRMRSCCVSDGCWAEFPKTPRQRIFTTGIKCWKLIGKNKSFSCTEFCCFTT